MVELISGILVVSVLAVWVACGYAASHWLRRKGYAAADPASDRFPHASPRWDPISGGAQAGPQAYRALLPFLGGPLALLLVA